MKKWFKKLMDKWNKLDDGQKKMVYVAAPAVATFIVKKISSKKKKEDTSFSVNSTPCDYEK